MIQRQKEYLADGLREVANLTIGALLLGQFLAREFDWIWTAIGLSVWVVFYSWGMVLLRGGAEEK
jgi:hypothetical protein